MKWWSWEENKNDEWWMVNDELKINFFKDEFDFY